MGVGQQGLVQVGNLHFQNLLGGLINGTMSFPTSALGIYKCQLVWSLVKNHKSSAICNAVASQLQNHDAPQFIKVQVGCQVLFQETWSRLDASI